MEYLEPVFDVVSTALDLFSVVILLWGIVVSGKDFFVSRFRQKDRTERMQVLSEAKNRLGTYVLFSLEVLIAADIVDTIVDPNLTEIINLGAIVAIRTVISYFLNKEIQNPPYSGKK